MANLQGANMPILRGHDRYRSALIFAIILGSTSTALANNLSISGNVNGSTLTIAASADRFAGAIESLTFRGVQFIDIADHGRQMQSAIGLNEWGECYNPNEAGSKADGASFTSHSTLNSIYTSNNILYTSTRPAFWLAPGEYYPGGCNPAAHPGVNVAQNTSIPSNYTIARDTRFSGNLLLINTHFTVPENVSSASVEALTAYLPASFNVVLQYERVSKTLTRMPITPGPHYSQSPLILALTNGSSAMGVTSPDIPLQVPQGQPARYFAYRYWGTGSTPTSKWSCVHAEGAIAAGTTLHYTCPVAVGNVDEVMAAIDAYPVPGQSPTNMVPVFRFYHSPQHFLTRSYSEGAGVSGWAFETTAFHLFPVYEPGMVPLYRCYNPVGNDHFMSTQSNCEGRNNEGVMGFAKTTSGPGLYPLYRFYRSNIVDHLMTINYSEGANNGYADEGVLGYVGS